MSKVDAAMRFSRAVVLVLCFLALTLLLVPVQWIAVRLRAPASRVIPLVYHRMLCRLIGIRVMTHGSPKTHGPVLLVANHTSWLDIPILSSVERLSFVAKREVGQWPFFGLLARLQRTVFIERGRRTETHRQRDEILARLGQNEALVLFPEGTSGDGNRVLGFNTALFSVAENEVEGQTGRTPVLVQPVSVAYTRLHGMPMGRQYRPTFAWYGEMSLVPHLWAAFGAGPIDVVLHFHPPVTVRTFGTRKALARHCEQVVAEGVALALAGRPAEAGPVHEEAGAIAPEAEERVAPAGIS